MVTLVVSDLHLGAEEALDDFYADEEFADFLAYHRARHLALHLVINGDWIDYLQIDPTPEKRTQRQDLEEIYPMRMTEAEAVAATERTIRRHPVFFAALREFLAEGRAGAELAPPAGNDPTMALAAAGGGAGSPAADVSRTRRLTVLRGNHDIEVAFAGVQQRMRTELGSPGPAQLDFPPVCYWDAERGLYVEHGCQYDAWNTFARFEDPFLDRKRTRLEVPFGSVIVKTFWNRIEGEFPYVDKIRPMSDSVTAIVVQRPTYPLLKFDYFVDLALAAGKENLRRIFSWRAKRPAPPAQDAPEAIARRFWKRPQVGRIAALVILVLIAQFAVKGVELWTLDAHLRASRAMIMLRHVLDRFVLQVAIAAGLLVLSRLCRFALWKAGTPTLVRSIVYRLMVLGAAGCFFEALGRVFWLPLVVCLAVYLVWDGRRTLVGQPLTDKNPLTRSPLDPDLEAAVAILRHPQVRTVVFGHTHGPMEIEVSPGRHFINSGTWVKVVDVRNVREDPSEPSTYVHIDEAGSARLMSWRGSQPATRVGGRKRSAAS
jgi:hypothetical protein